MEVKKKYNVCKFYHPVNHKRIHDSNSFNEEAEAIASEDYRGESKLELKCNLAFLGGVQTNKAAHRKQERKSDIKARMNGTDDVQRSRRIRQKGGAS